MLSQSAERYLHLDLPSYVFFGICAVEAIVNLIGPRINLVDPLNKSFA